jgi:hypothetical protein
VEQRLADAKGLEGKNLISARSISQPLSAHPPGGVSQFPDPGTVSSSSMCCTYSNPFFSTLPGTIPPFPLFSHPLSVRCYQCFITGFYYILIVLLLTVILLIIVIQYFLCYITHYCSNLLE